VKGIDGSALAGAPAWPVNGFAQAGPDLRAVVEADISDTGKEALKDASTRCVGDALFGHGFTKSTTWTKDGEPLADVIAAGSRAQAVLDKQRIGVFEPAGPVRAATGVHDDIVPRSQARRPAADRCDKDGNITYGRW
jgi:hypothetical protein